VRCVACGREGYDRAMPIEARGAFNLVRMLAPLDVDGRGLCDQCAAASDRLSPED
jgi:hypothetical protein